MFKVKLSSLVATCLLAGCAEDTGTISVRVYGEAFIEEGIPAADMNDGWAVAFSRFEVSLSDIAVAGVALENPVPLDVSSESGGEGHEVGTVSVPARTHGGPSFTISRVEVEGSAEKADATKSFSWVFDSPTRYRRCQTNTAVAPDETASLQITIHADHLFYDSLVAREPQLLFQPLANADADDDGEISASELAEQGIGAYDPGNEDIDDLWAWLVAQQRTLGHVDGEGHCEATALSD